MHRLDGALRARYNVSQTQGVHDVEGHRERDHFAHLRAGSLLERGWNYHTRKRQMMLSDESNPLKTR